MLLAFWILLFVITAFLVLLIPVLWGFEIYKRHSGIRVVICPENGRQVAVSFDALHATKMGMSGRRELRLADCTRWPEQKNCEQECISQASREEAYAEGEVTPMGSNRIHHLPVLVAAFVAWCIGAIWHSQYLFRLQWTQAVGLGGLPSRQVAGWLAPHLLSFAICFLFSYGVAWLLALTGKKGIGQGVISSVLLWGAVALTALAATGVENISPELLRIEVAYTFFASVVVGGIQGAFAARRPAPVGGELQGGMPRATVLHI